MGAPSRAACHPLFRYHPSPAVMPSPKNVRYTLPVGKFMLAHLPGSSLPLYMGKIGYLALGLLDLRAVSENLDTRWFSK